jgi:hypothetical protein
VPELYVEDYVSQTGIGSKFRKETVMDREATVEITSIVPKHLVEAFMRTTQEFFAQSRRGNTSAQRAAEVRAQDRDAGLDSLVHLVRMTEGDTGQCGIIARFLAGLYNSTDFPFKLTELRGLDEDLFEHCLAVLRLDNTPTVEIQKYLPAGDARLQRMIKDWNLDKRPVPDPEPERGTRYNACYITHGTAPGYRDITLCVKFDGDPVRQLPVDLHFNAEDSARIAQDILDVHKFAWKRGPIDAYDGEKRPSWL